MMKGGAFCLIMVCFAFVFFTANVNADMQQVHAMDMHEFCLSYKGEQFKYSASAKERKSDIHIFEHKLQRFGKKGTYYERAALIERVLNMGFSYEEAFKYVFADFDKFINKIIKRINRPARDAKIYFRSNKNPMFSFADEEDGFYLDKEELYKNILREYKLKGFVELELQAQLLSPRVFKNDLEAIANLKSKFSTYYGSSGPERKHNIRKSLARFNGLRLEPGEEYSFNKITGKRTHEKGYLKANIIVNEEYVEGYGGGVCQTSTTLYNALILAGLEVTEVHRHSLPSSYVALGFDAMVSYGSGDLKFKNNTGLPVFIKTYADAERVFAEVYGAKENPDYKIKRVTEVLRVIPPAPGKTTVDEKGEYTKLVTYDDETAALTYPKDGYEVNAYLEYYLDGELVSRKLIRHETYKPQQGVYVRGALKRPPEINLPFYNF